MELLFFCPRWGSEHVDWSVFLPSVKAAGYDGVEVGIPAALGAGEAERLGELLAQHELLCILQHYDTYTGDFAAHKEQYAAWLEQVRRVKAFRINSQTGKDFFSIEQNRQLVALADEFSAQCNIPVLHETHRNKFSFAAHVTHAYLQAIPSLQLTLDISHWVNVAESYLEDQPEAVALAIDRTVHLHARVGYPEGPQVPDPRTPEWREALDRHLAWWDRLAARKRAAGEVMTITPEFGPPPYLVTLPATGEPIASQWDINLFMMALLKARYQGS